MKKVFLLGTLLWLPIISLFSQPVGWTYTQAYTITNNTAGLVTNYQAQLTINTQTLIGSGQMLATGADILFGKNCPGTVLYNYWIESGINTTTTTIWVKIDTLFPSATRQFYMFYGNSSATAASAVPGVFIGPMSSTDSVASGGAGGSTLSQRGFRFAPTEDILVTAFGKREPNGSTRYVTLFNFTTQAIVSQQQVSGPAAQYSYQNIANPIWLTNGTQYLLELYQGASDGYYFGTSSQIGQQLTYFDMRYCNSCTQNTFPTSVLGGYHYGYPDLWYWRKNTISPAPTISVGASPLSLNAGSDLTFCFGGSGSIGAVATGGSGSYTYSWVPTNNLSATNVAVVTANPTVTTTYTLTATDLCGSVVTDQVLVTVNSLPTVTANTTAIAVCSGGSVTLTGGGASTYSWSGGVTNGVSFVPTVTNTYTVTGTDGNSCVNTATITVNVNALPNVTASATTGTICVGSSETLTAGGASSYSWSSGGTTAIEVVSPIATSTYTVTGTDGNGCVNTATVTVNVNALPNVTVTAANGTICAGSNETLTAAGATSYSWSSGGTTAIEVVSPLITSTYTVTGTDGNGCQNTATTTVTVNALPIVTLGNDTTQCGGTIVFDAGNVGATYLWSNSSTSQMTTVSATGIYFVEVTNANGCSNTDTVLATINANPIVDLGLDTANCGSISLDAGNVGATYIWNDSTNSQTLVATTTGTYYVEVTDANGCVSSDTVSVTVNNPPSVTATAASSVVCVDDAIVVLTGTPVGGAWAGPGVTGSSFNPSIAGVGTQTATYSYTDPFGCEGVAMVNIQVNACVGVFENSIENGVNVFPNPFSSVLIIKRVAEDAITLNLFDASGRLVMSKNTNGKEIEIKTSELANGIYSLQLIDSTGTKVFRVTKNN